jgi:hypothetical protein
MHSVTIKFSNRLHYINSTNSVCRGWTETVKENIIYALCKFQPVCVMHMRIINVWWSWFFRRVESLETEQRTVTKFCVKLKKTATETFEMLKSVHFKECLSQTCVSEWRKRFKERSAEIPFAFFRVNLFQCFRKSMYMDRLGRTSAFGSTNRVFISHLPPHTWSI